MGRCRPRQRRSPNFYIVTALDAIGNESAPSNEASGTPEDKVAPPAPVLHAPGFPSLPARTTAATATVIGTAEPGATVSLFREGRKVGEALALSASEQRSASLAEATWIITVPVADRPDFSLSPADLVVLPAIAQVGETVRITVTVRNTGVLASLEADLALVALGPNGFSQTLVNGPVLGPLPPGGLQTATRDLTFPDVAGTYTVVAAADPLNQAAETSEANNRSQRELIVAGDDNPLLSVAVARREYRHQEDVLGTVDVINPGPPFAGRVNLRIEDEQGVTVAALPPIVDVTLEFGQHLSEAVSWNTGFTFAGGYRLRATLIDDRGVIVQTATIGFAIDKTPPMISVSGVQDGGEYRSAVAPVISVADVHSATRQLTLDGEPFVFGTTISREGLHELRVVARDVADNHAEMIVRFRILGVNVAALTAALTDRLAVDSDGDGRLDPGETLSYEVVIANTGDVMLTELALEDFVPPYTALVAGSLATSSGEIVESGIPAVSS